MTPHGAEMRPAQLNPFLITDPRAPSELLLHKTLSFVVVPYTARGNWSPPYEELSSLRLPPPFRSSALQQPQRLLSGPFPRKSLICSNNTLCNYTLCNPFAVDYLYNRLHNMTKSSLKSQFIQVS